MPIAFRSIRPSGERSSSPGAIWCPSLPARWSASKADTIQVGSAIFRSANGSSGATIRPNRIRSARLPWSRRSTFEPAPPIEPGLKRVAAKLRQHKPITIVTMGDSLSDPHHWSNHPILWSGLLVKGIKDHFDSTVTLVNPAIGGTTLSQNIAIMPRWSKEAPSPDLVTVWFGGNDWDSNVRGPRFAEYLRLAVDRIRRQTHGSADILLMTTLPGHARWETMKELEQAAREVAAEKKTGFVDIAGEFRKAPSPDAASKLQYWGWDNVHLGAKGHEIVAAAVIKAMEEESRKADPRRVLIGGLRASLPRHRSAGIFRESFAGRFGWQRSTRQSFFDIAPQFG